MAFQGGGATHSFDSLKLRHFQEQKTSSIQESRAARLFIAQCDVLAVDPPNQQVPFMMRQSCDPFEAGLERSAPREKIEAVKAARSRPTAITQTPGGNFVLRGSRHGAAMG